jgi:hypothetical protein
MTCTHHYLLETPHGSPTVTGTCKLCGHTRVYRIDLDEDGGTWLERSAKQKRRSPVRGPLRNPDSYLRNPQTPAEAKALAKQEREWAQKAAESPPRPEKAQTATRTSITPKTRRERHCRTCAGRVTGQAVHCRPCSRVAMQTLPRYAVCIDCGGEKRTAKSPRCPQCAHVAANEARAATLRKQPYYAACVDCGAVKQGAARTSPRCHSCAALAFQAQRRQAS